MKRKHCRHQAISIFDNMKNMTPKSVWRNPLHFTAFGFGTGAMPFAPGTFGTLPAIPLYWYVLVTFGHNVLLAITIIGFVAGVYLCDRVSRDIGVHDHGGIVWDEIIGYLVTMLWVPMSWVTILLGFALFRLFDIWKPFPIRTLDKKVAGGFGIMVDDLLAGIYANICLQLIVISGVINI